MTVTAQILADSVDIYGNRITSFELVYPRIVHSELMTHRVFSKNSASSRAIPVKRMNEIIREDIARPVHFGQNQSGMQDAGEHFELINGYTPAEWWDLAVLSATKFSDAFDEAGYHKQVCNRLTEAGQHMKVVLTTTCIDNWFNLRNHEAADPTIHMLAVCMLEAFKDSTPRILHKNEWHMPYYGDGFWSEDKDGRDQLGFTLSEALRISSSCCAQVSYRRLDDSLEKANDVFARLVESEPVHASPTEHQATPIEVDEEYVHAVGFYEWPEGVTHLDKNGVLWSGNLKAWIQHRQLIPNHVCEKYDYQ